MPNQDFFNTSDPLFPPRIVYLLFALGMVLGLIGTAISGILPIAGLVYAFVARGKDPVADTHLNHLILSFVIAFAIGVVGALVGLIVASLQWLIILAGMIWMLARLITGFLLLNRRQAIAGTQYLGACAI